MIDEAKVEATPCAYAVRNADGYWCGIWNTRATAEGVMARGQPSHGEQVVPLFEAPPAKVEATPCAYAVRNADGYWCGIWNTRATAEGVMARGQPSHGEQVVPLFEAPPAKVEGGEDVQKMIDDLRKMTPGKWPYHQAAALLESLSAQLAAANATIASLRKDLADPPPDVQEAVLQKLGIREELAACREVAAAWCGWSHLSNVAPIDAIERKLDEGWRANWRLLAVEKALEVDSPAIDAARKP